MAKNKLKYDFKSVGFLAEDHPGSIAVTRHATPFSIKSPIRLDPTGASLFEMHYSAIETIKDNLRNLLVTNHGSRLCMPTFGANLVDVISIIGTEEGDGVVMQKIASAVGTFMPHVSLSGYDPIRKLSTGGSVEKLGMTISFTVPTFSTEEFDLTLNLFEAI